MKLKLILTRKTLRATGKKYAAFSPYDFAGESYSTDKTLRDSQLLAPMKHNMKAITGIENVLAGTKRGILS